MFKQAISIWITFWSKINGENSLKINKINRWQQSTRKDTKKTLRRSPAHTMATKIQ